MTSFCVRHRLVILICAAALLLRVAYRHATGGEEFWSNGYSFFYDAAQNLVAGKGLTLPQASVSTLEVAPLYPLLLAPSVLLGGSYLAIVLPQAVIGMGTVLCALLIGRGLFNRRAGLIAAAMAAVYPYYVVHDTALQETGLLTFCMTLSTWLLLRMLGPQAPRTGLASGVTLGLSVLVRPVAAPFALAGAAWTFLFGQGSLRQRSVRTLTLLACVAVIAGGWMASNMHPTGRPTGFVFWVAHNPMTFSHYPRGSIDDSTKDALAALPPADWKKLRAMPDPVTRDSWFLARGHAYLAGQGMGEKLTEAGRKVWTGFSWVLNPEKPGLTQWIYFISYTPVLALGLAGMILTRQDWRRQGVIYLQFMIFIAITAVLWAHTSHRAPLDVYLMIFAGAALDRLWSVLRPPENAVPERPDR